MTTEASRTIISLRDRNHCESPEASRIGPQLFGRIVSYEIDGCCHGAPKRVFGLAVGPLPLSAKPDALRLPYGYNRNEGSGSHYTELWFRLSMGEHGW